MAVKKNNKDLKDTIKPEDIVMKVEEDDSDMPAPETKEYKSYLKVTDRFKTLFTQVINSLPYNSVIANEKNEKIRLIDFVRYVEQKQDKITVPEMNNVISYIAQLNFNIARPLMEVIENREQQATLWTATQE